MHFVSADNPGCPVVILFIFEYLYFQIVILSLSNLKFPKKVNNQKLLFINSDTQKKKKGLLRTKVILFIERCQFFKNKNIPINGIDCCFND